MKRARSKKKGFELDRESLKRLREIEAEKLEEEQKIAKHSLVIERVPTFIKGFDEIIEGGIPKNSLILVTGGPGTGKTTFGLEFIVQGALRGEKGIYVSMEDDPVNIEKQIKQFGWPIERLEKENRLFILKPGLYDFTKLKELIQDTVSQTGAKRLVIDSISLLRLYFKDAFIIRRALLDIEKNLREIDCTTIIVSEVENEKDELSRFGVEEFISDGIIFMYMQKEKGEFKRGIVVRKMRLTNHSLKIHPISINTSGGIEVDNKKEME